jgi:hypothetical protein
LESTPLAQPLLRLPVLTSGVWIEGDIRAIQMIFLLSPEDAFIEGGVLVRL